jgi:adenylosuccinate synthase
VLPGWCCDIRDVRHFADLPANARRYVERIEELLAVPVKYVSVGPAREAIIER